VGIVTFSLQTVIATNNFVHTQIGNLTVLGNTSTTNLTANGNTTTTGTNNANAYKVGGVLGITEITSNLSAVAGVTNVQAFSSGILTNKFTIP